MARKAFVVDDSMREKVRYLAGVGVRQDDIAKIIGCAPKTLRKRFRDELDRGVAEANAKISGHLFATAKAGNITAQIFWLKTRAHWREGGAPDEAISGTDPEPKSEVVVVLPDNSRDPELTQVLREAQDKYFARKSQPPELRAWSRCGTLPGSRTSPRCSSGARRRKSPIPADCGMKAKTSIPGSGEPRISGCASGAGGAAARSSFPTCSSTARSMTGRALRSR